MLNIFFLISLYLLSIDASSIIHHLDVSTEENNSYYLSFYEINSIHVHKCRLPCPSFAEIKELIIFFDYFYHEEIYNRG